MKTILLLATLWIWLLSCGPAQGHYGPIQANLARPNGKCAAAKGTGARTCAAGPAAGLDRDVREEHCFSEAAVPWVASVPEPGTLLLLPLGILGLAWTQRRRE